MAEQDFTNAHVRDVIIVGAGPCGLAVAARLCEGMPAANFTDEEHQRYHWIRKNRHQASVKYYKNGHEHRRAASGFKQPDFLVLDATADKWMAKWERLFKTYDISHLRSPMFFHIDPAERDGLLGYAYRMDREKELTEIRGCVGKEISKYQRKKKIKQGMQPRNEPTVDERERSDYFVPSTPLFFSHCDCVADRYDLRSDMIRNESVLDIKYSYIDSLSPTTKLFTVKTGNTTYYAKSVVLALGGNAPILPTDLPDHPDAKAAITHAMHIKDFPSPPVRTKIASKKSTNMIVVGGGLTSAQIADLAIKKGVGKVYLLMRGPLKVKHFDIGLEWVGKFRNFEQAAFWSSGAYEERWEKIMAARNGGSITPVYKKILDKLIAKGKVELLLHTEIKDKSWDEGRGTWNVRLCTKAPGKKQNQKHNHEHGNVMGGGPVGGGEQGEEEEEEEGKMTQLPPIDHIYLATGVPCTIGGTPCLQSMMKDYPVKSCGGLPCITDDMAWRSDVPMYVNGRLAMLQLGPGAPNLIGARTGAERVCWGVQDYLREVDGESGGDGFGDEERGFVKGAGVGKKQARFNFLTGRCSRFEALDADCCD